MLGDIDLDPASSLFGQSRINATKFFAATDNGLQHEWHGRVWLNPPYAQPLIQQFIEKLIEEYRSGRTKKAILLTHNYTDTKWFHLAESAAVHLCFTLGRIRFEQADGRIASPTQGQVFFYYGENGNVFSEIFSEFGFVR